MDTLEFEVAAIQSGRKALVNGEVWNYLTESSRTVYLSPDRRYVLKADTGREDSPEEALTSADRWGYQSLWEAEAWKVLSEDPEVAEWFIPVVGSGVKKLYIKSWNYDPDQRGDVWKFGPVYRSWSIQTLADLDDLGEGMQRSDERPPDRAREAYKRGFQMIAERFNLSYFGTDAYRQFDRQFRIYDYGL